MTGAKVATWLREEDGAWKQLELVYPPMAQRRDATYAYGNEAKKSNEDMWTQLLAWTQAKYALSAGVSGRGGMLGSLNPFKEHQRPDGYVITSYALCMQICMPSFFEF